MFSRRGESIDYSVIPRPYLSRILSNRKKMIVNRRHFIAALTTGLGATACRPTRLPDRNAAHVRVTGCEVFHVGVNRRGTWVIPRLETNAGLTGIGDASQAGPDDPQIPKIHEYAELLKGRSVYDIEWFRQKTLPEAARHLPAAACAMSGLEQALYDIQGQIAGIPTFQLFGGKVRDKVRNYANINRSVDERNPKGFATMAERARRAGFDAIKLAPFDGMPLDGTTTEIENYTALGIDCARLVREVLGSDGDLLIDAHSYFDLERGLRLAGDLEPHDLFWLEEVSDDWETLASINRAVSMPTAGGEFLHGVKQNHRYIAAGAADILMPDVKYCSGMLELKRIAALAEGAGLPVSPHGPASPVGNMSATHICAGLSNFLILEHSFGEVPWRAELVDPPEVIAGGYLAVPDRPGFGIRINEKVAQRYKV